VTGSHGSAQRAVALLSGGLDSGVALADWLSRANTVQVCLCADYGQRAFAREAATSRALAERYGLPWRRIDLPWLADAARATGAAQVEGSASPVPARSEDDPGDEASAAAVWIPARNVVLVAMAAAVAEASGADVVLAGFNREEAATFPDNSAAFLDACTAVLALGTRSGVRVESPTLGWDKVEIAARAVELGLGPADFSSCYEADGDPATCCCESCVRSRRAWARVFGRAERG
jgi:7-cyano-7-deazaguanine synthase